MKMRYIEAGRPPGNPVAAFQAPPASGPAWPFAEPPEGSEPLPKVQWAALWRSVWNRRWLLAAAALVAVVCAALYAYSIKPAFRSTTTLLIESSQAKLLSIDQVYGGASQDREYYQTQVEILRSQDVALRTVIATKLWDEPEFDPRLPNKSLMARARALVSAKPPELPWTPERLADEAVGRYLSNVTIEPVRLSQLVKISFEATDRDLAAKVADATANAFIEADRNSREKLNLSATSLLQDRLVSLREKLVQSEQELQKYRESAGLVSVSGSQGVAAQQMVELNQRLVTAHVRRTELESNYQQAARITDGDYSSIGLSQPGLNDARNRVATVQMQLDELTRTAGEQNPKVIEARTALAAAQREVAAKSRAVVVSLRSEAAAAAETERALQAALQSARSTVQGVNRQEFQLSVLEREVQTNKQLYELFLSRTKETGVTTNLQGAVGRIVDPARPSGAPFRPNRPQIVLAAMMATLLAGMVLAIAKDRLTKTLRDSDEAENRLQVPVLASLPEMRGMAASSMSRSFVDDPKSSHAQGIRSARTNMLLSKFAVAHKIMLVTSALTGEGKTTFCTNLALAHATSKRTLLIDCDLRNPQIGQRLGLPADAKGIADLVSGTADLKDCVHAISGSSLLVMPAGELVGTMPEEFLLSPPFRDALKSLANRVDVVLVDAPPVAACSDALIISQQANDTVFVVKARNTPHPLALRGLERLQRAGASILGVVLTNVDESATRQPGEYGAAHSRHDTVISA